MSAILPFILKLLANGGILKDLAEVVIGNRKDRDTQAAQANTQSHEAQGELYKEFGAEFTHASPNRSMFDKIMDGLNRMPRPIFAFGTIAWFGWCAINPESFERSMKALVIMPEWGWAVLGTIITFFFGGRMMDKTASPSAGVIKKASSAIADWKRSKSTTPPPSAAG